MSGPPPAVRRSRYWSGETVEWAERSKELLDEHGMVCGTRKYANRYRARWQVRHLIEVLTDLQLCERGELREHVDRRQGGYMWTLERVRNDG